MSRNKKCPPQRFAAAGREKINEKLDTNCQINMPQTYKEYPDYTKEKLPVPYKGGELVVIN